MIKMYIDIHIKYPLFLSNFNETKFSRQIFEIYSSIKLHENLSSGSRVGPCRQAGGQMDGWTDTQEEANICFS
jgi:hypothetical protein